MPLRPTLFSATRRVPLVPLSAPVGAATTSDDFSVPAPLRWFRRHLVVASPSSIEGLVSRLALGEREPLSLHMCWDAQ